MADLIIKQTLTNLALRRLTVPGIAYKVAPVVNVLSKNVEWPVNRIYGITPIKAERASNTDPDVIDIKKGELASFTVPEQALKTRVDNNDIREINSMASINAHAKILELEKAAVEEVQGALDIAYEIEVAGLAFDESQYPTGNKVNLAGSEINKAENPSNIFTVLKNAKKALRAELGANPNTLTMGYEVYEELLDNLAILNKLSASERSLLDINKLKQLLGFKYIYVGEGVYKDDDNGKEKPIWGKHIRLSYTPQATNYKNQPIHMVTFRRSNIVKVGTKQKDYYREIHANEARKAAIVGSKFGYLIYNAVV